MASSNQLIVCTFAGEDTAEEASARLQMLGEQDETLRLNDIAVLRKRSDGSTSFWETLERQELNVATSVGTIAGWVLGAVGTLLGAPLGPGIGLTAGDAAATELAAERDSGFPDEMLQRLAERLNSDESALIMLVAPGQASAITVELELAGGRPVQSELSDDLLRRL